MTMVSNGSSSPSPSSMATPKAGKAKSRPSTSKAPKQRSKADKGKADKAQASIKGEKKGSSSDAVATTAREDVVSDSRFMGAFTDPRFARMPRSKRKVRIDSQFKRMFEDEDFQVAGKVDKYGRKNRTAQAEDLGRFYHMGSSDEEEDSGDEADKRKATRAQAADSESDEDADDQQDSSDGEEEDSGSEVDDEDAEDAEGEDEKGQVSKVQVLTQGEMEALKAKYETDDWMNLGESSDEDEEALKELLHEEEEEIREDLGALAEEVPTGDATRRIAIQNIDWENVKAKDILAALRSFCPADGAVHKVVIYPSDYGLKQMEHERIHGPSNLFDDEEVAAEEEDILTQIQKQKQREKINPFAANKQNSEGIDMIRLKRYELNKLKYYYAVVECDSAATGGHLYAQCDGMELEHTGNVLDMRFVPDDMDFAGRQVKEEAGSVPANYQPPSKAANAAAHSNVQLSWDQEDPERIKRTMRKFNKEELQEMDFKDYLADSGDDKDEQLSFSSMSDADVEDPDELDKQAKDEGLRNKYKALLADVYAQNAAADDNDGMEITFQSGIGEAAQAMLDQRQQKRQQEESGGGKTAFQRSLDKRRQKRKEQKRRGRDGDGDVSDDSFDGDGERWAVANDGDSDEDKGEGGGDDFFQDADDDEDTIQRSDKRGRQSKGQSKLSKGGSGGSEGSTTFTSRVTAGDDDLLVDDPVGEEELRMMAEMDGADDVRGHKGKKKNRKGRKAHTSAADEEGETSAGGAAGISAAKASAAEMELMLMDEDAEREKRKGYSLQRLVEDASMSKTAKRRQKKKRRQKGEAEPQQDAFKIDTQDPRFSAIYTSADYAIDPTNPQYKATAAMKVLAKERLKRRTQAHGRFIKEHQQRSRKGTSQSGEEAAATEDTPRASMMDSVRRLKQRQKTSSRGMQGGAEHGAAVASALEKMDRKGKTRDKSGKSKRVKRQ